MAERFLFQDTVNANAAILTGDQAHHLSRVMRAKPGEDVVLFDGQGTEHLATITEVSKNSVKLRIDETRKCIDRNVPPITVAVALPKGDRQKFLVEKLVELGASSLIPLKTQRSVAEASEKVIQRIEKQIIEATKQCRRSWLMEVNPQVRLSDLIAQYESFAGTKFVADPYDQSQNIELSTEGCVIAIGPEGGFTDAELEQLTSSDWKKACFSPNVLRIETAAIAAVAILRAMDSN